MKILHISHSGMPDARVEKMGLLAKNMGHEVCFAGPVIDDYGLGGRTFDSYSRYKRSGMFDYGVRDRIRKIIKGIKPDIIHAHDIFAVVSIDNLGVPFVFDDHEFFSTKRATFIGWSETSWYRRLLGLVEVRWWRWLEKTISQKAPVITVSNLIAEHYKSLGSSAYVIPNYPSRFELDMAKFSFSKNKRFSAVYLGKDIHHIYAPYRDSRGITELFEDTDMEFVVIGDDNLSSSKNVTSTGFIPHMSIYKELSKNHVGIIPWKSHPYHQICSLNKTYLYAHCGLAIVLNSSFENMISEFGGNCLVVEDMQDLKTTLLDLQQDVDKTINMGSKVAEFAQKYFIVERYTDVLEQVYNEVLGYE